MADRNARYEADDRVRDILEGDSNLLLVLNRFRIPFGFANSTIKDVCEDIDVDPQTFLAVANLISGRRYEDFRVSLPALVAYLREAHSYILDFTLPRIRETLVKGVVLPQLGNVAMLTVRFFDEYMEEVRSHMEYEDSVIFPYVDKLLKGECDEKFTIRDFASKHDSMVEKLNELKDLFLQHYSLPNTRALNTALFNIISCGDDLLSHCEIENRLLVPAVEQLERSSRIQRSGRIACRHEREESRSRVETLSDREKEIIALVAHGLSNKEIADRLCLSFHTVTTYRKNLSAKLNIHSSAGLTIFAILHKIIDLNEIEGKTV